MHEQSNWLSTLLSNITHIAANMHLSIIVCRAICSVLVSTHEQYSWLNTLLSNIRKPFIAQHLRIVCWALGLVLLSQSPSYNIVDWALCSALLYKHNEPYSRLRSNMSFYTQYYGWLSPSFSHELSLVEFFARYTAELCLVYCWTLLSTIIYQHMKIIWLSYI